MNNNPTTVTTGQVRLSYTHLFNPYANPVGGGEAKYSVTILVPKSDFATKQRIDAALDAATKDGVSNKWGNTRPPVLAIPVHDGDGTRPSDGMPFSQECKGHWVFTASSMQPPEVVDMALNRIINQTEIYSGIYGRVSVNFFPYANSGKKGIGCGLNCVQKTADGVPLGGRISATEAFGEAPVPGAYAQPQPTYQQGYQQTIPNTSQAYQQPPAYQPMQPPQVDPITGQPYRSGGVMGI